MTRADVAFYALLALPALAFGLAGAACRDAIEPRARTRFAEAVGAEVPATCVTARGGDGGDDITLCTNGTTLTVCVEGGGCITVMAPAERPAPREPR